VNGANRAPSGGGRGGRSPTASVRKALRRGSEVDDPAARAARVADLGVQRIERRRLRRAAAANRALAGLPRYPADET
jgi:hypothetical protein